MNGGKNIVFRKGLAGNDSSIHLGLEDQWGIVGTPARLGSFPLDLVTILIDSGVSINMTTGLTTLHFSVVIVNCA